MPLKNYTSKSTNTFDRIQKCLASHGAQKLMFDYDGQGRIMAIAFAMDLEGRMIGFRLPARIDNVANVMYRRQLAQLNQDHQDQVYRTAWANIRDWVEAQMALIDTKMAKMQEVFLPYMTRKDGKTLYESLEGTKFLLPGE